MVQKPDRMLTSETAWQKTVAREAVIRPLAFVKRLIGPERFAPCRQLGLKPTRFYELLGQFRRKPVTSSLLDDTPGLERGTAFVIGTGRYLHLRIADPIVGRNAGIVDKMFARRRRIGRLPFCHGSFARFSGALYR